MAERQFMKGRSNEEGGRCLDGLCAEIDKILNII